MWLHMRLSVYDILPRQYSWPKTQVAAHKDTHTSATVPGKTPRRKTEPNITYLNILYLGVAKNVALH